MREIERRDFDIGELVMTNGVMELVQADPLIRVQQLATALFAYIHNDWGDVDDEDWETNDNSVRLGNRILAQYEVSGERIWIITEWDRSVTTVLLPEEY